jgi:hypothetical protein
MVCSKISQYKSHVLFLSGNHHHHLHHHRRRRHLFVYNFPNSIQLYVELFLFELREMTLKFLMSLCTRISFELVVLIDLTEMTYSLIWYCIYFNLCHFIFSYFKYLNSHFNCNRNLMEIRL